MAPTAYVPTKEDRWDLAVRRPIEFEECPGCRGYGNYYCGRCNNTFCRECYQRLGHETQTSCS